MRDRIKMNQIKPQIDLSACGTTLKASWSSLALDIHFQAAPPLAISYETPGFCDTIQRLPCAVHAHFLDPFRFLADSMRNPCGPRSILRLVAAGRTPPASYGTTTHHSMTIFGKRQILKISFLSYSFVFLPMWFDTYFDDFGVQIPVMIRTSSERSLPYGASTESSQH